MTDWTRVSVHGTPQRPYYAVEPMLSDRRRPRTRLSIEQARARKDPRAVWRHGPTTGALRFVIQKHAATRLHYDLRLEHDGVLLSWAVPQGISLDPSVKRFAAHTEDHPLDYADFEGVIPHGEYGAGPMIVWDRGSLDIIEDPKHGVEQGKLLFDLHGYKVNGRFTLVKTTKGPKDWLLIKKPDAWSRDGEPEFDESSVLSGLTIDDLAHGSTRTDKLRDLLTTWSVPPVRPDSPRFEPMLAEAADEPFSRPGWLFEIKYDGYRMIAHKSDNLVLLHYRSGRRRNGHISRDRIGSRRAPGRVAGSRR